ncbi:MAG: hypothetical protein WKF82_01150 [Nocardioidaceae bacterium]
MTRSSRSIALCLERLGAARVVGLRPESRAEANDPALAAQLDAVSGVFMTGGNQLKLSAVINATLFGSAIVSAHERGATVGERRPGRVSSRPTWSRSASAVRHPNNA